MAAESDDGSLGYIFLDVISCGLGGALLLGVILAVPKEQQKTAVSTAPYVVLRAEVWDEKDAVPDFQALPNVWIKPPGAESGFDLPLEQFDLKTGRSRRGVEVHPNLAANGLDNTQLFLTGFFRHAEGVAELAESKDRPSVPLYELVIAEPPAGEWEFRIRYQNRRDLLDFLDPAKGKIPAVSVRVAAYAANASTAMPDKGTPLEFGQRGQPVKVNIPVGKVKNAAR